jgi:hypothetical protein
MIYTFYSYKGGVGRTMALANIAELFYRAGQRVLMIDWDLEAPGLEHFFFPPQELDGVRRKRGLIDLVMGYKHQMTIRLDLSDPDNLPFEPPHAIRQQVYPRASAPGAFAPSSSGQLWLITAGKRVTETPGAYAKQVLEFDWTDFYERWQGEAYFDWFRRQCKTFADVILIDSRTGVTEMSGVCTYHLADVVVLFCAANNQNIRGTLDMLRNFSQADPDRKDVQERRLLRQRGGRPLKMLVVPARIEMGGDLPQQNTLWERLRPLAGASDLLQDLAIPYIGSYSFEEQVAVRHEEGSTLYSANLVRAYQRIFNVLGDLREELRDAWERRIAELQQDVNTRDTQSAELKIAKTLTTDPAEKTRLDAQVQRISAERRQVDEQLRQLRREIQYYRMT